MSFCFGLRRPKGGSTLWYFNAQGGEAAHLRPQSLHSKDCGVCVSMKSAPTLNSTPIVRQYGILLTNGVLFYAKRESK